jgi:hypothetical protein
MKQPINFFQRLNKQPLDVNGISYVITEPNVRTQPRLWLYPAKEYVATAMVIYIDFRWDKAECSSFVVKPGHGDNGECVSHTIPIFPKDIQHPNEFINRFLDKIVSDIHETSKHLIWQ